MHSDLGVDHLTFEEGRGGKNWFVQQFFYSHALASVFLYCKGFAGIFFSNLLPPPPKKSNGPPLTISFEED